MALRTEKSQGRSGKVVFVLGERVEQGLGKPQNKSWPLISFCVHSDHDLSPLSLSKYVIYTAGPQFLGRGGSGGGEGEKWKIVEESRSTPWYHKLHDDAHPEGENSARRQKTSEYEAYVSGESSSGQFNEEERGPSTSGNQEQEDDYDFWTDSYASDDDEIPTKHESRKESFLSTSPEETTPLVQSCQRDPEAQTLSQINKDLLYLKKGSSRPEKIVLSLHKFLIINFNDEDIEERTSRWVNKCVKKFNPYARYGVEHWKISTCKIFLHTGNKKSR
ncbi:hypothetical protein Tco_0403676 [Tanacetum coccineum]